MKKILSIILVLAMLFTLVACGTPKEKAPAEPSTPENTAPEVTAEEPEPAEETEEEALPPTGGLVTPSTIGWYTDDVDHFARDPYKIVYICGMYTIVNVLMAGAFERWGERLNFDFDVANAEGGIDVFFDDIENFAVQGYDGFILDGDQSTMVRMNELCNELELTWITCFNPCRDDDGKLLHPGVVLDSVALGRQQADWMSEHMTEYFGEVDIAKVGMIGICCSTMPDLFYRGNAVYERFMELYPEVAETNCILLDVADVGITAEAGYDKVAATVSANPQFEYWLIGNAVETTAQGAARALEANGKDKTSLVMCIGAETLMGEWD
ncbi:MAG: hypothetical protein HUJ65_04290, partial [Oscillospiraceae bacterium]|nr:hypothetical protein [Oscillospiraceae bacterium]